MTKILEKLAKESSQFQKLVNLEMLRPPLDLRRYYTIEECYNNIVIGKNSIYNIYNMNFPKIS